MKPAEPSHKGCVLIVEDEALIALDLERRLLRAGFEVAGVADNSDDALRLFKASQPDLVLMDIRIRGDVDGIEAARRIHRLGDVPVVFLTAFADEQTVERAAEVTPYGYLLKPLDERALIATLTVTLERHHADTRMRVLEAAVSQAALGVMLVEAVGDLRRIALVNDAFVAMTGMSREAIGAEEPCFLVAGSNEEPVRRLRQAISEGTSAHVTIHAARPNSERFWADVTVSPVADRAGSVTHLLVFHRDVTAEREAQSALAASQRLEIVGRLSAGVAHDFNNVLCVISGYTALVNESLHGSTELRADLEEILQATRRGSLLTRKLLQFSRGSAILSGANADIGRVARDLRGMVGRLAGPGVVVAHDIATDPMFVGLDETSLEQILLNLVANARDAMPEGGQLTITLNVDHGAAPGSLRGGVRLVVSDSGTGMPAEVAAQIFDPFFTTKSTGTGLGLATCKILVEIAGGSIRVESEPGKGSSFVVDFPIAEAAVAEAVPGQLEALAGRAAGAPCLVVEDDTPLRRAMVRVLGTVGFTVAEAHSGEVALRRLATMGDSLQLLVCDLALPGLGGADVIARVRSSAPRAAVLVTTGYLERLGDEKLQGASVLWKPYSAAALARRALDLVKK